MTIYVNGTPILGIASLNPNYPTTSTYQYVVLPNDRYNDVYSLLLRIDNDNVSNMSPTTTFLAYKGFGVSESINAATATFTGT